MKLPDWKNLTALLGMAFLFGASFTGTKVALQGFSPFLLIFLRFGLSTLCFAAFWKWMPKVSLTRGDFARLFCIALLEPGLYFYAEAEGVQRTLASTASVLISTIPLFVLALEALFLKTRVRLVELGLMVVSIGGIYLLVASGGQSALGGSLAGNSLILLAALSASVYTVLAKKLLDRIPALTLTFFQSLFATLTYLPFAAFGVWKGGFPEVGRPQLTALLYLGVFCSFVAYALLNFCLSRMRASFVSAFANLIPVVGTAVAFLVLGERLFPVQILGAGVVLLCMTALTLLSPSLPATHPEG